MPKSDVAKPGIGSHVRCTYLLRVWREADDAPWRALLRNVTTQEEQRFGDLAALLHFLETQEGGQGEE